MSETKEITPIEDNTYQLLSMTEDEIRAGIRALATILEAVEDRPMHLGHRNGERQRHATAASKENGL